MGERQIAQDLRQIGRADLAGSACAMGEGSELDSRLKDRLITHMIRPLNGGIVGFRSVDTLAQGHL